MTLMVIGKPIKHSLSPAIHNHWINKYNLNYKYLKKEVEESELKSIIKNIKEQKIKGVNITLPYKNKIFKLVDALSPYALASNAVNTLYLKNHKVVGDNTDGKGFANSFKEDSGVDLKNKNIFLIGAGGAAQGILAELINQKVNKVKILNRTKINAKRLINKFANYKVNLSLEDWEKGNLDKDTHIVINTSSFGMRKSDLLNIDIGGLSQDVILYDIIYNPPETQLIKTFKKKGFRVFNGLGMLIHQAAISFSLWFNIKLTSQDLCEARKLCEKKI